MLIDAHNHPNWQGHDARRILRNMDEQGIDQMWLLSWEAPADEYSPTYRKILPPIGSGIPLADVLSAGRQAPDRFVLGYMPHPKRPDAVDRLRAAVEIHGIRVAGELKVRLTFDDPDAVRLYRYCGQAGLPVIVHLDYPIPTGEGSGSTPESGATRPDWWYGGSIEALERALIACPETVFVGHAPGFWAHISGDDRFAVELYPTGPVLPGGRVPEMLRRHRNLWADLSAGSALNALSRDRGFGRAFLLEFQDRLLFGRDDFSHRLIDHLVGLDLPREVMDKLTHRNAQRLLTDYL